jgi:hypothetical protein
MTMLQGEVAFHFARVGMGLGLVDDSVSTSVVIIGIVITLLTHPLLKLTLIWNLAEGSSVSAWRGE